METYKLVVFVGAGEEKRNVTQHSNVYLEKDEHQALHTRKHYIQIFFG